MKKLPILLISTLAAGAAWGGVAPAAAQAPTLERAQPVQVTRTTTPRRDRFRPYTFTTTGRIVPPANYCAPGQSPAGASCVPIVCPPGATNVAYCTVPGLGVICSGSVTVRVQKRGITISGRVVGVRPDCTYRSRVTFRSRLPTRIGRLSFRARFQGNVVLEPKSSSTGTVLAG